jgi:putative hydrolase of the HAD superfamily
LIEARSSLMQMDKVTVVFDGDDTLWLVEHLYDDARVDAAKVVASDGVDPARWEALEREIDVRNVGTMGVSAQRFPTSCVEAYIAAAAEMGRSPSPSVEKLVQLAAEQVFERRAPVVVGAHAVVEKVRTFCPVVLLTKGEPWVQERRIEEAGFASSFDEILIVPSKSEAEFEAALRYFDAAAAGSWSVGNSLASDVNPALNIGMSAVWIDAHVWEHERRANQPVGGNLVIVPALADVPDLIAPKFGAKRHGAVKAH